MVDVCALFFLSGACTLYMLVRVRTNVRHCRCEQQANTCQSQPLRGLHSAFTSYGGSYDLLAGINRPALGKCAFLAMYIGPCWHPFLSSWDRLIDIFLNTPYVLVRL